MYHHLILVCFASRPTGGKNRKRGCNPGVDVWVIGGGMAGTCACKSAQEEVASGGYN